MVVHDIGIVDDCSPVIDICTAKVRVAIYIAGIDMACRGKYPKVDRYAYCNMYAYCWHHWSPSIITISRAPVYPRRSPLISGDPAPSSMRIVYPATIVKWCPPPGIVRDPGIPVFSHGPIAISAVWTETMRYIGVPDVAISLVIVPVSIGRKLIIKYIKRYMSKCLCFYLL